MTDAELVLRSRGGDEIATRRLVNRYSELVRFRARSYFLRGGESDDLIQEGLLGLYKAIRDYRTDRESSFRNFAELCITRQIITAVKTATRNKHTILDDAKSLDAPLDDDESATLGEVVAGPCLSPFEVLAVAEERQKRDRAMSLLTPLERAAIRGIADGRPYEEIAATFSIGAKAVDNAAQRARRKLSHVLAAA